MVGKDVDMTATTATTATTTAPTDTAPKSKEDRDAFIIVAVGIAFMVVCVTALALAPIGSMVPKAPKAKWAFAIGFLVVLALSLVGIMVSKKKGSTKEGFGPTLYQCSSGNAASCPVDQPLEEIDASVIAKLPLKPCNLYLTSNIQECDDGMYQMHVLELKERRAAMETENARYHAKSIARIDRVLEDAARLKRRQCKFTMNDWVRPDHSSFPLLKVMKSDTDNRLHPRHWAYCYAPLAAAGAKEALLASLETNELANGPTLARTGFEYKLSNELNNERVEFNTMDAESLRRTFCTIFNPALQPGLQPFYSLFKTQPRLLAMDLTPDGIVVNLDVYDWDDGFLRRLNPATLIEVESGQDNNAEILTMDPNMAQDPVRFNRETSYYCKINNVRSMKSAYTEEAKALFTEVIEGGNLVLQLKTVANVYVFNVNVCDRVDKVETMSGDLAKMLGNAQSRGTLLRSNTSRTRAELISDKMAQRSTVCNLAIEMTQTYKDIQAVLAEQRQQGEEYRLYSQPDSGQRVVMSPQTVAKAPIFQRLRQRQLELEAKFADQTRRKAAAVAAIQTLNMMIADVERTMENIVTNMRTQVQGKKMAIPLKPYKYITNDGRMYFKM